MWPLASTYKSNDLVNVTSINVLMKLLYKLFKMIVLIPKANTCRILVWEDGFCDFARVNNNGGSIAPIPPDLFFKMSHEVYNYGEG